jgi:hypothetical protein
MSWVQISSWGRGFRGCLQSPQLLKPELRLKSATTISCHIHSNYVITHVPTISHFVVWTVDKVSRNETDISDLYVTCWRGSVKSVRLTAVSDFHKWRHFLKWYCRILRVSRNGPNPRSSAIRTRGLSNRCPPTSCNVYILYNEKLVSPQIKYLI